MKIREAFPSILSRPRLVVKSDYPLIMVLYLLRMREIDAVPISHVGKGSRKDLAVFGFTSLAKLLSLGPGGFSHLLMQPCSSAADTLPALSAEDELEALIESYSKRRLGFAMVHGEDGRDTSSELIGLSEVLELYRVGKMTTDMKVKDVASPLFSLPAGTSIRTALRAMFKHRYRRVFLRDQRQFISDRDVMDHLFNPVAIDQFASGTKDPLSTQIGKLKRSLPAQISQDQAVLSAVRKLDGDHTTCLVTTNDHVVTPWDLVMKPLAAGRLKFAD